MMYLLSSSGLLGDTIFFIVGEDPSGLVYLDFEKMGMNPIFKSWTYSVTAFCQMRAKFSYTSLQCNFDLSTLLKLCNIKLGNFSHFKYRFF